ncbi:retrovirus-related pol polyprotein from transposon TNT 1-94 [Tanacetum coccineum]
MRNVTEAHPRKVKSSLKNKDCVGIAHEQHSKSNANSELKCVKCNGCMLSDNHDLCVLDFINNVNAHAKSRSTFTIVGNACPLTRITTTIEVPLRKASALENETPKPIVTLVYSRKPRKSKTNILVSKSKSSKLNDHVAKTLGYGDYHIGNVTISRVYYVQGLGYNLFSIGQFSDSKLEVALRQHPCFIRNLEGIDLLTGSRGNNLYTLSLVDMMASSPICLLSKALKTKSWLWHRRLSHLNFGAINHLDRHGLVRGLSKLKFEKDHLCSACVMGKSKKKPHKPKSKDTNQERLYLLHMDLLLTNACCRLRSKDEAPDFIIKFLKMIQVRLKVPVQRIRTDNGTKFFNQTLHEYYEKVSISHEKSIARSPQQNGVIERRNRTLIESARNNVRYSARTDNGTEFVNQTLRKYYEQVGISHETSVARPPQQNGVVERRNRTLIEAVRTMLIYAKAPLFLWAKAVATARPALHDMTPTTISSGLVPNPPPSTSFVPPSRTDWDLLFQLLFDELLTPQPSVDRPAPEVIAPIAEVVDPEPAASTGSPSSTTVDQDAPSPSNSQTSPKTQSPVIPNDVEEENHDLDVAHMNTDPFFGIPIPENDSEASSSSDVIPTIVHTAAPNS